MLSLYSIRRENLCAACRFPVLFSRALCWLSEAHNLGKEVGGRERRRERAREAESLLAFLLSLRFHGG